MCRVIILSSKAFHLDILTYSYTLQGLLSQLNVIKACEEKVNSTFEQLYRIEGELESLEEEIKTNGETFR